MIWYKTCPKCVGGDMVQVQGGGVRVRKCVGCGYEETFATVELQWAVRSEKQ
jgi:uncharacterized metal-binding protein (TIGR02443 family)